MLPKKNRISRDAFTTLLKNGAFFHSPTLSLRVMKTPGNLSKFSFVVSKKVSKSAVRRNLLRHRGYSILQAKISKNLKEKMNTAVLGAFFFKKGADKLDFLELQGEIEFLLKKSGIL